MRTWRKTILVYILSNKASKRIHILWMGLENVHKQGRDEITQEDYPISAKNTQQK